MAGGKPNIEFISMIEGVEETMPIIPAHMHKYRWLKRAAQDFSKRGSLVSKHQPSVFHSPMNIQHTARCPGIIQLKNKGFIVRNHQDIHLKFSGDDDQYEWMTPLNQTAMSDGVCEDQITHHFKSNLYEFFDNWPKDTMKSNLKINLPWQVRVPKGYELLMIDPFYKDDFRFTVCPGIFDHNLGIARINVPTWFHMTSGETLIKAGTPIAQLIPIKKEEIDYKLLNPKTDKHYKRDLNITGLKLKSTFNKNYTKIRKWYEDWMDDK